MAGFMETAGSPGGLAAIGAIGSAINAIGDGNAQRQLYAMQTTQLREQIAYQRKIMEEQVALREQERVRQQMMARAAGDAFANSLGQYQGFEGKIGASGNQIADTFRQILGRGTPDIGPQAEGPTADRIASATQFANDNSSSDANALGQVQGLAKAFSDSGTAVGRNNQFASLMNNFAGGSQQASQAEIEARAGQLFQPRLLQPQPSMMGDLFVGLANAGVAYGNRPPPAPSMYDLAQPGDTFPRVGLQMPTGPSTGLRIDRPAGLGITGPNGMRIVGD